MSAPAPWSGLSAGPVGVAFAGYFAVGFALLGVAARERQRLYGEDWYWALTHASWNFAAGLGWRTAALRAWLLLPFAGMAVLVLVTR